MLVTQDPLQKLVLFTQSADYCTSSGRPLPPRKMKIKRAASYQSGSADDHQLLG